MKGIARIILLTGTTSLLAACACPVTKDYNQMPYVNKEHGTAGEGVAVYEGRCPEKQPAPETRVYKRETTVYKPRPEKVFQEEQRK